MGSRMAKNLLSHGANLTVYNRSPEPLQALREAGAHTCRQFFTERLSPKPTWSSACSLHRRRFTPAFWAEGPSIDST